jgi:hypothetical protein
VGERQFSVHEGSTTQNREAIAGESFWWPNRAAQSDNDPAMRHVTAGIPISAAAVPKTALKSALVGILFHWSI